MAFNEVDSTNLESIKSARRKVASPRFGGSSSALMTGPKKAKKKARKRTVVK
jgi:hypothetical protein